MNSADDCFDDWEAAADAGLDPKPIPGLIAEHEQNRRLWEEANRGERYTVVYQDERATQYTPEVKLLRRPTDQPRGRSAPAGAGAKTPTMTLDHRQRAYDEARRRIFGDEDAGPGSSTSSTKDGLKAHSSTMPTVADRKAAGRQSATSGDTSKERNRIKPPRTRQTDGRKDAY
ncbi:hypothetical protein THASP1DRAFT_21866 [Thamnocephalis sphaerospora]|uniref:SUZ domain-containing protein n=1 Tax=Thamnocephalis sphaerospora TaxID=78915 RepID=A0A4P9XXM4_9FUNG|nr:hypothetical protein THASP1DRAFT_21866 [Thamnocephalis sphaerospora]|eukprot:RKP10421.1 hypothetical protein THASP1DRAFT_21866 [Thamnocephalis sphaerospora]